MRSEPGINQEQPLPIKVNGKGNFLIGSGTNSSTKRSTLELEGDTPSRQIATFGEHT
jgi:hypothetical protein